MFSIEFLRDCFSYNPSSGILTWIDRPISHFSSEKDRRGFNTRFSGKQAGNLRKVYRSLVLTGESCRKDMLCHRIAFFMYHEYMPKVIDHFDGNPINNSISNLRPATNSLNCRNKSIRSNNKSGIVGVCWNGKKWVAFGPENLHLGKFKSIFEAACARKSFEVSNGYTNRNGSSMKR